VIDRAEFEEVVRRLTEAVVVQRGVTRRGSVVGWHDVPMTEVVGVLLQKGWHVGINRLERSTPVLHLHREDR
jgi:hypothetical protein